MTSQWTLWFVFKWFVLTRLAGLWCCLLYSINFTNFHQAPYEPYDFSAGCYTTCWVSENVCPYFCLAMFWYGSYKEATCYLPPRCTVPADVATFTHLQSAPMYVYRFLSELYICLLYSCKSLLVFIISNSNINIKPPPPLVLLAQWPAVCLLVSDEKTINQRRKQQCYGYHRRCGPFFSYKKNNGNKIT